MRLIKSAEKGGGYFDDADVRAHGADDGDEGFGRCDVDGDGEIGFLGQDDGKELLCQGVCCVGR